MAYNLEEQSKTRFCNLEARVCAILRVSLFLLAIILQKSDEKSLLLKLSSL